MTNHHVAPDTDDLRLAAEWVSGMLRDATDERDASAIAEGAIDQFCSSGNAPILHLLFSTVAGIYALHTATDRLEAPRDALTKLAAFLDALTAWERRA